MLHYSFHWEKDGDGGLVRNSVRKGSNNFKQHLLSQLCGCLIQALDIYMLFCNKESHNKEMKRIIEISVFFKAGSNFPWFHSFMKKKNNNFGTHSVLTELETCQVWRSFTLWYYARPKTGVIMVYSRRLVGLNYLNGRCILVSLLTIYICITQWLAMLLSLFDYKLTSQGIGLGGKEGWVYKAFMWGGPTKILELISMDVGKRQ